MIYATVADVRDRLQSDPALLAMWPTIDTAADFASLSGLPLEQWSIYVVPSSERAQKNGFLGGHIQTGDVLIGLVYCIQAANDASGRDAMREASARIDAARRMIAGWTPGEPLEVFDFAQGVQVEYRPGLLIWRDDFTARALPMSDEYPEPI